MTAMVTWSHSQLGSESKDALKSLQDTVDRLSILAVRSKIAGDREMALELEDLAGEIGRLSGLSQAI